MPGLPGYRLLGILVFIAWNILRAPAAVAQSTGDPAITNPLAAVMTAAPALADTYHIRDRRSEHVPAQLIAALVLYARGGGAPHPTTVPPAHAERGHKGRAPPHREHPPPHKGPPPPPNRHG